MGVTETEGKVSVHGFENVFRLVGGHGRFQCFCLVLSSMQLLTMTWGHMSYIFIGAVPQHWCKIPELEDTSWTIDQIKNISIPKVYSKSNGVGDWKYEQCQHYNMDWKLLLEQSEGDFQVAFGIAQWYHLHNKNVSSNGDISGSGSDENNLSKTPPPEKVSSSSMKSCQAWSYDRSIYLSTIVTEFDLVCSRRYLVASIQAFYMIGAFAGTLMFGPLNDKFLGRRNTTLITTGLVLIGGFSASFSYSYVMFICSRFLLAIGTGGCMQSVSIWFLEHCDTKSRARLYCIAGTFFGIGYAIMPVYAYYIRTWNNLQLAFTSTTLSLLSFYWLFPESPRWLASHGRDEEAVKALEKIAKFNKMRPQPERGDLLKFVKMCHLRGDRGKGSAGDVRNEDEESKQSMMLSNNPPGLGESCLEKRKCSGIVKAEENGCLDGCIAAVKNFGALVSTPELRRISFVTWALFVIVAFVYYGFAFSSVTLTTNPYLLVSLGALMEVPASVLPIPFLTWWGRRPTTIACYLITGLSALVIAMTPGDYEILRTVLSMAGKLFVASAFTVLYLVVSEVYPTVIRGTGQGSGTLMGRFGSIAAPYAADYLAQNTAYPDLPSVIFGILAIIASIIAILLPEMKNVDMKDQVYEYENQHNIERRHSKTPTKFQNAEEDTI